ARPQRAGGFGSVGRRWPPTFFGRRPADTMGKAEQVSRHRPRNAMAITSLFERFKKGLAKTARVFNIRSWFGRKVDQSFLDDLEARLIQADVGVKATAQVIDRVREAYGDQTADENLLEFVKAELKALLSDPRPGTLAVASKPPTVYLIAGVNGSGKTTSIAKL